MRYFIANLKAHKDLDETLEWYDSLLTQIQKNPVLLTKLKQSLTTIIVCASYITLFPLYLRTKGTAGIFLGAQDISAFDNGSYTGETTARMIRDFVSFALIGHSERRSLLNENDDTVQKKIKQALRNTITPVLCIQGTHDVIPPETSIVAYEPPHSIGSGLNEDVSKVLAMKSMLKLPAKSVFLYGGSANEANMQLYLKTGQIDGFILGTAARDPLRFYEIVTCA